MVAAVRRVVGAGAALLLGATLLAVVAPWAPRAAATERAAACRSGTVSLTFDDGPSSTQTPRLVRTLKRAGVPATFFMVGQRVAAAPRVARRVSRAGFLVANHSYAHADMRSQSSAAIRRTLRATGAALRRAGARPTNLMRPPYGAVNARVLGVVRRAGLRPVMWDVDPRDWESVSASTIAARVLAGLRPQRSNVVLQHDGVGNSRASISAVPRIVSGARRRGYCFVALDEMGRPGFPTPRTKLAVSDVREGREARVRVSLDKPAGRAVWVRVTTRDGTATGGHDFRPVARRLRIPAGATSAVMTIPVVRDRLDERTERFTVLLTRAFGVSLATREARVRIADRDPEPVVRGRAVSVAEPVEGPTTAQVRFQLGRVSGRPVTMTVRTEPGTATPDDYVALSRRVTIPAGRRFVVVPVTIRPDDVPEPDETFTVSVTRARNARIGPAATVTITP
jgi:peptidoglycan/xylan/chitin deacetylase (PgdA/CDA1 family)